MPVAKNPTKGTTATVLGRRKIDFKQWASQSNDDQQTFRPSMEGDTLTGRLQSAKEVTTKFGQSVVIEFVDCKGVIFGGTEQPDGDYNFWPTSGAIDSLDSCEADAGDLVRVTLTELIDTGKGNPFKAYEARRFGADDEPF